MTAEDEENAPWVRFTPEDFDRARGGDREMWSRILEANMGLAWSYVSAFGGRHPNLSLEECNAAAAAGLAAAVVRYDPRRICKHGRPARFSTVAHYWMRRECQLMAAEDDRRRLMGVPPKLLAGDVGGWSEKTRSEALAVACVSLPDDFAGTTMPRVHDDLEQAETLDRVWAVVDGFSEPIATALRLYYREGLSQDSIGKRMGVTGARVQQLVEIGIRSLRIDLGRRAI